MRSPLMAVLASLTLCALSLQSIAQDTSDQAASAADWRIVISQGAFYSGPSFRILKQVALDTCQITCLGDDACRAFTYNQIGRLCELKDGFSELTESRDVVSGRVVANAAPPRQETTPPALTFLPGYYSEEAERYRLRLAELDAPGDQDAHALWRAGHAAMAEQNPRLAAESFRLALRLEPEAHALWTDLVLAVLSIKGENYSQTAGLTEEATSAAINAYRISSSAGERARALSLLAVTLERRQLYRPALEAYKASLLQNETASVREAYEKLHAQHGFRMVDYSVDSDAAQPRICIQFSEDLQTRNTDFSSFLTVNDQPPAAVDASGQQICIDGAKHGERYTVAIRQGIPARIGEVLERSTSISVYVRDRSPSVRFTGRNYVLPRFPGHGIPLVSVNTDTVKVRLMRVGDRALMDLIGDGRLFDQLSAYAADDLAEVRGEDVWQGELDVERVLNTEVTTKFPIDEALPERKPGVYVMVAEPKDVRIKSWQSRATQWFIVSDIGLSTLEGADGLHVFARSLSDAGGLAGVEVRLIARNNEILGTTTTDAQGHARFEAGLVRGKGGTSPALVTASLGGADYAFLDILKPAFDLSDRGVQGRTAPGPLDVFLYTERGIYRPGATVHVSALVRDRTARAAEDIPLTFIFSRPDGVEHRRMLTRDGGFGGHVAGLDLQDTVMQGTWRVAAYTDTKAAPLAEAQFLVEDFVPDRIEFDLSAEDTQLPADGTLKARVSGRFLYGAPASGLYLEGDLTVRPTNRIEAFPDYSFGLQDEDVIPVYKTLTDLPVTDENGDAVVEIAADGLPQSTRPLTAQVNMRMREGGGRAVERSLSLSVERPQAVLGIKPHFETGGLGQGETAAFSVIAVAPDGKAVPMAGLSWELLKIERNFQWYRVDGTWNYEPVNYTTRVANGRLDLDDSTPGEIASQVAWGRYRLEIASDDPNGPAASYEFHAGWYVEVAASDTPDMLQVTLDKEHYSPGETARVNLESRFDGTALVMVVGDRLIDMKAVEVKAGSTVAELQVDDSWGPGAYVTATVFRPAKLAKSHMPGRAIGLQWLKLDMSERTTTVTLDAPDIVRPNQPLDVLVKLANAKPGEKAFVTVAAVDVGILNLTRFEPPKPESWYFGQRALGVEFRDLYGQLIDGMQGVMGRIRSGAGEFGMETKGSPPAQKPVALFSGIVETDDEGRATVSFDVPAFNGTLRLMAVGWTKDGIGSGTADVTVRDPVVVTASLPRFMAPGDASRMRLEIDNTEGPDGEYQLTFEADDHVAAPGEKLTVDLAAGKRTAIQVPLTATRTGDGIVSFRLSHPSGIEVSQTFALAVRPAQPPVSERQVIGLDPGSALTIDQERLAQMLKGSGSVSLSITRAGGIDVPSLLHSLDRYPYGCAEQTASRALPLLYLSELATRSGLGAEPEIRERVQKAVYHVLTDQSSTGSFGLWGPGSGDIWLDAYVSDFLTRAREQGYTVPDLALGQALDNLQNAIGVSPDPTTHGAGIAYGLYVLARNRRAALGDLRYYVDTRLADFASSLARAQLGAALALYGETERARTAFRSATQGLLHTASSNRASRSDYGSLLRDAAATLSLAAESKPVPTAIDELADFVARIRNEQKYTSTQEKAWLLLAARALLEDTASIELTVNGIAHHGNLVERLTGDDLVTRPFTVTNRSETALDAVLTVTGIPDGPRPAGGEGFTIERTYYTLDGKPVASAEVGQNERFVVVLKVREHNDWVSRIVVADLLPAGFEIDNPRLIGSADLQAYPWLEHSPGVAHLEFRDDSFVAALNRQPGDARAFTLAYVVRAVTPGAYALPPAVVEDMYRPHLNARTDMGRIEVIGPRTSE